MGECETNEATSNSAIGICLVLLACLCYASGNCLQRYSLLRKKGQKVFWVLNRHVGWFVGAIVYFSANGIYAIALSFAPVSVLAAVFSLTIVANATCAWLVLGDKVPKLALPGYACVLAGSVCFSMTVQAEVCHFEGDELKGVMTSPAAIIYWIVMGFIIFGGIMFAYPFEKMYPVMTDEDDEEEDAAQKEISDKPAEEGADGDDNNNADSENKKELKHKVTTGLTAAEDSTRTNTNSNGNNTSDEEDQQQPIEIVRASTKSNKNDNSNPDEPQTDYQAMAEAEDDAHPPPLEPSALSLLLAGFIYPSSLGATEAVGALILKGVNSLFTTYATAEDGTEPDSHLDLWIGFFAIGIFIFGGIVIWLRLTYSRFQITAAFPVEFGMLTFASVVGGFAVFEDHQYVQGTASWAGVMLASVLILGGIATVGWASWRERQQEAMMKELQEQESADAEAAQEQSKAKEYEG